jgi:hypothetical protein
VYVVLGAVAVVLLLITFGIADEFLVKFIGFAYPAFVSVRSLLVIFFFFFWNFFELLEGSLTGG